MNIPEIAPAPLDTPLPTILRKSAGFAGWFGRLDAVLKFLLTSFATRFIGPATTTIIPDADLSLGQFGIYFDEATNRWYVVAKRSNGVVVRGYLTLT